MFDNYEYKIANTEYIAVTYVSGKRFCYFLIGNSSSSTIYLGDTFFRNYYIYHDVANSRVGLYGSYMQYYDSEKNFTWIIVVAAVVVVGVVVLGCVLCCICKGKSASGGRSGGYSSSGPRRRGLKSSVPPVSFNIFNLWSNCCFGFKQSRHQNMNI